MTINLIESDFCLGNNGIRFIQIFATISGKAETHAHTLTRERERSARTHPILLEHPFDSGNFVRISSLLVLL